jgi:hypothetical protein
MDYAAEQCSKPGVSEEELDFPLMMRKLQGGDAAHPGVLGEVNDEQKKWAHRHFLLPLNSSLAHIIERA